MLLLFLLILVSYTPCESFVQSFIIPHKSCIIKEPIYRPIHRPINRYQTNTHWTLNVGTESSSEKILRETIQKENEGDGQEPDLEPDVVKESKAEQTQPVKTYTVPAHYVKPRPKPRFLLEKAFEIYDDFTYPSSAESLTPSASAPTALTPPPPSTSIKPSPHIVILGTGWGAASFLKTTASTPLNITCISPRNFFLFTPMLAGASVGTVEPRSITEPVRSLNPSSQFLEATSKTVDLKNKIIECESVTCEGNSCEISTFNVSYDVLIISVGASTNTFGIPGVLENCNFLKSIEDARRVRTGIVNCFERASLPGLSVERVKEILTFAVIGAGPTGVEFASELRDFVEEEGPKYYSSVLPYVSIKVIEASSTILAPFDSELQKKAISELTRFSFKGGRAITELMLSSGVKEITPTEIELNDGRKVAYGLSVWAAGNGPMQFTLGVIEGLEEEQKDRQNIARGRLAVDPWLRVVGGDGSVLALGDCACNAEDVLPATAQVAGQQGEWLGKMCRRGYDFCPEGTVVGRDMPPPSSSSGSPTIAEKISSPAPGVACAFQFLNLGILAYTGGGSALAQVQITEDKAVKSSGSLGFGLWRSVYLSKQVSGRNRLLVAVDWFKTKIFGRDITRL
ncbi:hypothetical protein TrVE_jg12650 [Triparma verrucosa]|uniref:NADH:ubiquinone reductase (non-electrogenic) n=1 Tax=Triparma verrucosa TaxID=1606542 RepID=A0A9W7FBL0_9STRA|nr:hypothetical protein TrVE_jg12650 [Triparma verrucosa]